MQFQYRLTSITTTSADAQAKMSEQNMDFSAHNAGFETIINSTPDATFDIGNFHDAQLANFLERPLRILETKWDVGSPLDEAFNPWELFFTDPAVQKRVDNFARIRCNLHIKVVINATPFHYGRAIMHYKPWTGQDNTSVPASSEMTQFTQRPKIFINPTDNMGGEMELPFFHLNNWVDTKTVQNFGDLGELRLSSFGDLLHASGGTEKINITVFAWASDISMCVPTTRLSAQAGKKSATTRDEYGGGGLISKPASAIAQAASALASIPILAPYAMATKIASGAVAGIAKIFGFSRPIILSTTSFFKPAYSSNLATCDQPETVSKLTVDSKQEITIDPRTTGLTNVDELTLRYLTSKESFLTSFVWASTDAPDKLLFSTLVAPMLEPLGTLTEGKLTYTPTALSFCTWPFAHWSGTLKFRFQIICSSFHHGRLRFSYEPAGAASQTLTAFNTVYTEIVDMSEETDFELEVAWTQSEPYKETTWVKNQANFGTSEALVTQHKYDNGIITVRVLNDLTAPINNADVTINVFISAGDDFELAVPTQHNLVDSSYYPPQPATRLVAQSGVAVKGDIEEASKDHPDVVESKPFVGVPQKSLVEKKNLIFFGETVSSFRTLLRRYHRYRTWTYIKDTAPNNDIMSAFLEKSYLPLSRGHDPNGVDTSSSGPYNYVSWSLFDYLLPAYIGFKGGLRSKYRIIGNDLLARPVVDVHRFYSDNTVKNRVQIRSLSKAGDSSSILALRGAGAVTMADGSIMQPITQSPIVEVEVPFYTGRRFAFAQRMSPGVAASSDFHDDMLDRLVSRVDVNFIAFDGTIERNGLMEEFNSIAEDFNMFFFIGAPVRYHYSNPSA